MCRARTTIQSDRVRGEGNRPHGEGRDGDAALECREALRADPEGRGQGYTRPGGTDSGAELYSKATTERETKLNVFQKNAQDKFSDKPEVPSTDGISREVEKKI